MTRPDQIDPSAPDPPPAPEERRPWTVLFIGDHGRVIPFTRVKALAGLAAAAFGMSLAAVAVLTVVNLNLHRRTVELQQSLAASGRTISELRHERDLLTAHVALVEARMREMSAGFSPAKPVAGTAVQESVTAGKSPASAADGNAGMVLKTEADPALPAVEPPVGIGDGISIDDFKLLGHAEKRRLELSYKLVNTSAGQTPQAGSVVVVLRAEELPPAEWLTLPDVGVIRGRPANPQKGYSFSIRHSKLFEHSVPFPKEIRAYTHAVVYVFSKRGELLTAREYPVLLNRGSP
ncbi:MAG: hypothetical protein EHM15_03560 [Desulfobacteraceae bacterium]|nr:MAG: hypothetical protein EHM15_03560 [Desulfobacteraceae bacterium]